MKLPNIEGRLKELARERSNLPDEDPRRAEIENEISALCIERDLLKASAKLVPDQD